MSEATQQHLCMLNLKYIQTKLCSLIEIQPERRIRGLNGILPELLHSKFRTVSSSSQENGGGVGSNVKKFVIESDYSHIVILEVLKGLKLQGWSLLTSNAFMHIDSENTVETNFYFEKVYTDRDHRNLVFDSNPLDFVQPSISASLDSAFDETKEKDTRPNPKQSTLNSSTSSSTVSPEIAALIMEKSANQLGPYSFARRHSLLNTQNQRSAGAESDEVVNTDVGSSNPSNETGRKVNISSNISGRLAALKSGEKEKEEPGIQLSNAPKLLQKTTSSTVPRSLLPTQNHGAVQQPNQSGSRSSANPAISTPQQRQSISERLTALKNGISSSSSSTNTSSFFSTSSTLVGSTTSDDLAKKAHDELRPARGAPQTPATAEQSDSDATKTRAAAEAGQIPKSLAGKIFSKYRRKSVITQALPPTSSTSLYGTANGKTESAEVERGSDRAIVLQQSSSNDSMGSAGESVIPVSLEGKDLQHRPSDPLTTISNAGNILGSSSGYVSSSSSSSHHSIPRPPSFSPPMSPSTVPSSSAPTAPSTIAAPFTSPSVSSVNRDSVPHPLQNFSNVSFAEQQLFPSNTSQREVTAYSQPPIPIPIAVVVDPVPSASLPQAQSVLSEPSNLASHSPEGVMLQQNPLSRATPPAKSPLAANPMHSRSSMSTTPQQQQLRSPEEEESFNESRLHENEKTQHYSKLGSAFLQSTSLLGSRGGRGGRGRGIK
jgi:hypothetical protein